MNKTIVLCAVVLLSGACARMPQALPSPAVTATPFVVPAGTGSPAAAFCEQEGGMPDVFTDARGNRYGMCHLKDGRVIEEWEFLRNHRPQHAAPPAKTRVKKRRH